MRSIGCSQNMGVKSYAAIALMLWMATIARAQPPQASPDEPASSEPASSEPASSEPASSNPADVESTATPTPVEAVPAASATGSSTPTPARPGPKSEVLSVLLPVGVTVGGLAVFSLLHHTESPWPGIEMTTRNVAVGVTGIAALVSGPSLGQIYAGKLWTIALPIRLAGALVAGTGVVLVATRPRPSRWARRLAREWASSSSASGQSRT